MTDFIGIVHFCLKSEKASENIIQFVNKYGAREFSEKKVGESINICFGKKCQEKRDFSKLS